MKIPAVSHPILAVMLLGLAGCRLPNEQRREARHEIQKKPSPPALEAALPEGRTTDPFAIHHAQGVTNIPNLSFVEDLVGHLDCSPYCFRNLPPKRSVDGVYKVAAENLWPPDAAGTGPFFLIEEGGRFFVLTERNFPRVFGPIDSESEVLPYLEVYAELFLTSFGSLVLKKEEYSEGNTTYHPAGAPEITRIQSVNGRYVVRLVYYTMVHQECFYAIDVEVDRDGTVRKTGTKILKDFGHGIDF